MKPPPPPPPKYIRKSIKFSQHDVKTKPTEFKKKGKLPNFGCFVGRERNFYQGLEYVLMVCI
jgi:hypothetical protein